MEVKMGIFKTAGIANNRRFLSFLGRFMHAACVFLAALSTGFSIQSMASESLSSDELFEEHSIIVDAYVHESRRFIVFHMVNMGNYNISCDKIHIKANYVVEYQDETEKQIGSRTVYTSAVYLTAKSDLQTELEAGLEQIAALEAAYNSSTNQVKIKSIETMASGICERDTDGDGVADSEDLTPYDGLLSLAGYHSCLVSEGKLRCWGSDRFGELGPNLGLQGVTYVDASGTSTCPVVDGESFYCFGRSGPDGFLYGRKNVAPDLDDIYRVANNQEHFCIIAGPERRLHCTENISSPRMLTPAPTDLKHVSAISGQFQNMCAIADKRLYCWGVKYRALKDIPETVANRDIVQVSVGSDFVCAFADDLSGSGLWCWGSNTYGQLDIPNDLTGITQIAAGAFHACILADQRVRCWGSNGTGATDVPDDLGQVVQIAAGGQHNCAINTQGEVRCWGRNNYGQSTVPVGLTFK